MGAIVSIVGILILSAVGCAASTEAERVRLDRETRQAVLVLAESNDADSLAAAAVLREMQHLQATAMATWRGRAIEGEQVADPSLEALPLMARATSIAPDRADLAWLHAQLCLNAKDCDAEPIEARVRALDPSNGAGWMGTLSRALSSPEDATLKQALAAIGASERVDIYWSSLIRRLSAATAASRKMSLPSAIIAVIGGLAALGIPSYSTVSSACKGERLDREEITLSCRAIASAMMRGDTYITEMMGVAIAKRVWPPESAAAQAAAEARRVFRYRSALMSEIERADWNTRAAEEYLRVLAENHREQDAVLARIVRAGQDPDPPADWSDESGT